MATPFPIEAMSVEEKLRAMELLWDDLCNKAGGITSPDWHEDVLAQRQAAVDRGEGRFEAWDKAKGDIRSKVS